jgi:predicted phosphodiesterase
MRIAIMSDLHLEHDAELVRRAQAQAAEGLTDGMAIRWWQHLLEREASVGHPWLGPDLGSIRGVDLCILAGDIWHGTKTISYAAEVADYCGCPVVVVCGNHDLYGQEMTTALPEMAAAATATHGQVRFLDDARADFQ